MFVPTYFPSSRAQVRALAKIVLCNSRVETSTSAGQTWLHRNEVVACPLNTASIAAWAHFSPSALETPIAPTTWPLITTGSAPGCGKSFMKVGAKFSPLRTILFVSEVGRRQRKADFAFKSAVSMAFIAAPSMACDSIRLPPQSRIAIATVSLFFSAQAEQASTRARAPALEMTLTSLVNCIAEALAAKETISNTESEIRETRMRMSFLLGSLVLGNPECDTPIPNIADFSQGESICCILTASNPEKHQNGFLSGGSMRRVKTTSWNWIFVLSLLVGVFVATVESRAPQAARVTVFE